MTHLETPGIVIVTHNSAGFLAPCVESALARSTLVVVVDNASKDDTLAVARRYPQVRLVASPVNLGFAAAANLGTTVLSSEFVLLLNPDAVLVSALEPLVAACMRPNAGAASGKLVDASGKPQSGFAVRRFPSAAVLCLEALGVNGLWASNPINRRYRCLDFDWDQAQAVEQPAGAFLMFRRSVWQQLGGFDERFHPLWFEDVDFLRRMHAAGHRIWYEPAAVAAHYGGHSIASLSAAERHGYWYDNLLKYASKHFRPAVFRMIAASIAAGCSLRMIAAALATGIPQRPLEFGGQYGKVVRLAGRSVWSGAAADAKGDDASEGSAAGRAVDGERKRIKIVN